MAERERLAELIHKAELTMWGKPVGDAKSQREFIADYLLNHGIIAVPCKIGDTVYQTDGCRIYESTVREIIYDTDGIAFDETAIGTLVFRTREEAEAALAERRRTT